MDVRNATVTQRQEWAAGEQRFVRHGDAAAHMSGRQWELRRGAMQLRWPREMCTNRDK